MKLWGWLVSFSALLLFAVTFIWKVPYVVAFTTQLTPLNCPVFTLPADIVLFTMFHSAGAFSVTLTFSALSMNEFSVAFMTNGCSWYVSFGVVTVSTSMLALHPGSCSVMFSFGDSLWL